MAFKKVCHPLNRDVERKVNSTCPFTFFFTETLPVFFFAFCSNGLLIFFFALIGGSGNLGFGFTKLKQIKRFGPSNCSGKIKSKRFVPYTCTSEVCFLCS